MKLAINLPLAIYWQTLAEAPTLPKGAEAAKTSYERARAEGLGQFDGASLTRILPG